MRILVTGGAGFIGSHITDALLATGEHEVVILDSLDPSVHPTRPDYLDPRASLVVADVRNGDAVSEVVEGVEAVCHQAAKVGLGLDIGDIDDYVSANDLGTAVLLRALAQSGFSGRFVLASSMVVYGEGAYTCAEHGPVSPLPRAVADLDAGRFEPGCPVCGRSLDALAVSETAAADPRNVYAATKLQQEHLCFSWGRETGQPVTALRYHNVYGPRMPRDTPYAGVASLFVSWLAAGEAPRVFEDGRQLRDFVHVRDVAHANVVALTGPGPAPGAFNVCSGEPRTVLQMAQALCDAAGPSAPAPIVTGQYRLGDVRHVFASAERAASGLGFTADEDFAAGMAEFATAPLRAPAVNRPATSHA